MEGIGGGGGKASMNFRSQGGGELKLITVILPQVCFTPSRFAPTKSCFSPFKSCFAPSKGLFTPTKRNSPEVLKSNKWLTWTKQALLKPWLFTIYPRLILSPQTETFSGKRDFLNSQMEFPNGKCAFHLLAVTSSRPFGLDRLWSYLPGKSRGKGTSHILMKISIWDLAHTIYYNCNNVLS